MKWQHAIIYIDHFIIFWKTEEERLKHIQKILPLLKDAGITIKLKKCFFYSQTIDLLGHVIALGHLKVAQKTTQAIKIPQYSTTV